MELGEFRDFLPVQQLGWEGVVPALQRMENEKEKEKEKEKQKLLNGNNQLCFFFPFFLLKSKEKRIPG